MDSEKWKNNFNLGFFLRVGGGVVSAGFAQKTNRLPPGYFQENILNFLAFCMRFRLMTSSADGLEVAVIVSTTTSDVEDMV